MKVIFTVMGVGFFMGFFPIIERHDDSKDDDTGDSWNLLLLVGAVFLQVFIAMYLHGHLVAGTTKLWVVPMLIVISGGFSWSLYWVLLWSRRVFVSTVLWRSVQTTWKRFVRLMEWGILQARVGVIGALAAVWLHMNNPLRLRQILLHMMFVAGLLIAGVLTFHVTLLGRRLEGSLDVEVIWMRTALFGVLAIGALLLMAIYVGVSPEDAVVMGPDLGVVDVYQLMPGVVVGTASAFCAGLAVIVVLLALGELALRLIRLNWLVRNGVGYEIDHFERGIPD
ncbi:MAG: hypothetical protein J4G00_04445 [Actinomycetia bacterium]|nr:hypothetical protein [Actinomycetes bacterium]